jgi:hypothetical protein
MKKTKHAACKKELWIFESYFRGEVIRDFFEIWILNENVCMVWQIPATAAAAAPYAVYPSPTFFFLHATYEL